MYKLYLDGELVRTINNFNLDITTSIIHVGKQPPGWSESDYKGPVFETQLFMQSLDDGRVESQTLALMAKYADTPDWAERGTGSFDTGVAPARRGPHTVLMAVLFPYDYSGRREWILNFGIKHDSRRVRIF